MTIAILAVLYVADIWVVLETYAESKRDWRFAISTLAQRDALRLAQRLEICAVFAKD